MPQMREKRQDGQACEIRRELRRILRPTTAATNLNGRLRVALYSLDGYRVPGSLALILATATFDMCSYAYQANYKNAPKGMGLRCPCPELYHKAQRANEDHNVPALPTDEHGHCIFHSKEIEWKRRYDFAAHFHLLIQLLEAIPDKAYYDFCEFSFVGNNASASPGACQFNIKEMTISRQAYFNASCFFDALEIESTDFKRGISFCQSQFFDRVNINSSRFVGVDFQKAEFSKKVHFYNVAVISYCLFNKSKFLADSIGYAVKFEKVCFESIADFSEAQFDVGAQSTVGFQRS